MNESLINKKVNCQRIRMTFGMKQSDIVEKKTIKDVEKKITVYESIRTQMTFICNNCTNAYSELKGC